MVSNFYYIALQRTSRAHKQISSTKPSTLGRENIKASSKSRIFESWSFQRRKHGKRRLIKSIKKPKFKKENVKLKSYNRKKSVKCGHDDKAHYAKGMCNNCYHKYGRTKKPWNCPHEKLYAGGMCQNCYINMYNKKKRE